MNAGLIGTDPESTFVASACEYGVAVQGDGLHFRGTVFVQGDGLHFWETFYGSASICVCESYTDHSTSAGAAVIPGSDPESVEDECEAYRYRP